MTATLRSHPRGVAVSRILSAALAAAEPGEAIRRAVTLNGTRLVVAGRVYDLASFGTITLLAIGKARRLLGYEPAFSWRDALL